MGLEWHLYQIIGDTGDVYGQFTDFGTGADHFGVVVLEGSVAPYSGTTQRDMDGFGL